MKLSAIKVTQSKHTFYVFTCKASQLWKFSKINQRVEDKDEGYQRVLSPSRVKQLRNFIVEGNAVPGAVIVSFDEATFSNGKFEFDETKEDAAWIMDGQHRSAAAHEAAKLGVDIDIPVVAFVGLDTPAQTAYFVTINREAKSVPSSLYIDLLKYLPKNKSEKEMLEERVADITQILSRDSDSELYQRVVSTTSPKDGQLSLTNVARVLRPLIHPNSGILAAYSITDQTKIFDNYFAALKAVFPKPYASNLFFKTLGFGGVLRALPVVFSASLAESRGFRSADAAAVFLKIKDFDFDSWSKLGTGSQAEKTAGDDLVTELRRALDVDKSATQIVL